MPKYYCNICGNKFFPNPPGNLACPSCASNNTVELTGSAGETWWKDMRLVIPVAGLLVMLIVLFILPKAPGNDYNVSLIKLQEQCKFRLVMSQHGDPVDSTKFRYSRDDGQSWQNGNEFEALSLGIYKVKVEPLENPKAKINYCFVNPFNFVPKCQAPPADPCNCQQLIVVSAMVERIRGQKMLVVKATMPACAKQYSINGANGPWSSDSCIALTGQAEYQVWVKSTKCPPVAYAGNPVKVGKEAPVQPVGKYYTENQVDSRPYPTRIGEDRSALILSIREQCQLAGVEGSPRISFIINSFGQYEQLSVSGSLQNKSRISRILDDLGGWTSGEKDGSTVNTLVVIQL